MFLAIHVIIFYKKLQSVPTSLVNSDDLREHLKNAPKLIMSQEQNVSSDSDSSSSNSDSDSDSSGMCPEISRLPLYRDTFEIRAPSM